MKLLLDTHCWLWVRADPDRLPSPVKRRLRAATSEIHVSIASMWELAIKTTMARLKVRGGLAPGLFEVASHPHSRLLSIELPHVLRTAELPFHHKDPFDRLLVAQAQLEGLTLVTADPDVLKYDVPTIDARK